MKNRSEVQERIWRETLLLERLSSAIDRLPDSQIRRDMLVKHERVLMELNSLEQGIDNTDLTICYYGFIDKCPGCGCVECPAWIEKRDAGRKEEKENAGA